MRVTTLEQLVKAGALKDKRVFIRSDLNAPRAGGFRSRHSHGS